MGRVAQTSSPTRSAEQIQAPKHRSSVSGGGYCARVHGTRRQLRHGLKGVESSASCRSCESRALDDAVGFVSIGHCFPGICFSTAAPVNVVWFGKQTKLLVSCRSRTKRC